MKELSEQVFELENNLKDEEQKFTMERQEWLKKEQIMDRELQSLRETKEDLTKQNKSLNSKYQKEMTDKRQLQEAEEAANSERI